MPTVQVKFNDKFSKFALLDTGSSVNLISAKCFEEMRRLRLIKKFDDSNVLCFTATNQSIPMLGTCIIKVKINNFSWYVKFLIGINLSCPLILGANFISETGLVIDLGRNEAHFKFKAERKFGLTETGSTQCLANTVLSELNIGCIEAKEAVSILVNKYPQVFTEEIGEAIDFEFEIKVKDKEPVNIRPYPLSPPKMKVMKGLIDDLLKQKIIRPSLSAYQSPTFLVAKPGIDKFRLVTNYSVLNSKLERVNHPIGDLQGMFHYLQGAAYFTVLDLNNSFYQIKLKENCKHLTAFSTPFSSYEFNRIPYGLHCGSGLLSGYLDRLFHGIKFDYVLNFIDDVIVFSQTLDDHIIHLNEVVKRLSEAHLTVNPAKVKFVSKEISFLGHIVKKDSVLLDPARTKSIRDFKQPNNPKQVSRFIGMVTFFSRYIPDYATIAAPLNDLRRKRVKFKWTEECENSFAKLKECIINPPVLRMADFTKEFILMCDASQVGCGSCLLQEVDGVRLPIAYYSKKFSDSEINLSTYQKEALSVVLSLDKFHSFLEVRPFLLIVDNHALSWVLGHFKKLGKLGRWAERILSLPFRVEHVKAAGNKVADFLSRLHEASETKTKGDKTSEGDLNVNKPSKKERCVNNKVVKKNVNKGCIEGLNVISDSPLAFVQIADHQKKDTDIRDKYDRIKRGENIPRYYINKDILMFKGGERQKGKIVLPKVLIDMVFNYYHTSYFGGHPGCKRTLAKICDIFVWDDMKREIRERVKGCDICKMAKPAQRVYHGELIANHASKPMGSLYIDTCGPLVRSKKGNNTILIILDDFSKYTWLIPLRNSKSGSIIKKFEEIVFNNFSSSELIISDNGACFRSYEFKRFCFKYGVRHHLLAPYSPQGNRSERYLKTLKAQLKAYYHDKQQLWDKDLGYLQMSMNLAVNQAHNCTPFELMFNFKANHALSNLWQLNELVNERLTKEEVDSMFDRVILNLKRSVTHNKERRKYRDGAKHPFKVNSRVFVKTHFQSEKANQFMQKLALRYTGPYRIVYFFSPVTVLVQKEDDRTEVKRCHISQLKLG